MWLFTGCVMDAWQRDVHQAAIDVLGAAGVGVALPGPAGTAAARSTSTPGSPDGARRLAERVMRVDAGRRADPGRLGRLRRRS